MRLVKLSGLGLLYGYEPIVGRTLLSLQAGLSQLLQASPPGPLSIKDGEGEEVLAHGSCGGLRPERGQLWCMCAVFLGVFPLLCLFAAGVEPDEAVFKGVQMLHITLGFACL